MRRSVCVCVCVFDALVCARRCADWGRLVSGCWESTAVSGCAQLRWVERLYPTFISSCYDVTTSNNAVPDL